MTIYNLLRTATLVLVFFSLLSLKEHSTNVTFMFLGFAIISELVAISWILSIKLQKHKQSFVSKIVDDLFTQTIQVDAEVEKLITNNKNEYVTTTTTTKTEKPSPTEKVTTTKKRTTKKAPIKRKAAPKRTTRTAKPTTKGVKA